MSAPLVIGAGAAALAAVAALTKTDPDGDPQALAVPQTPPAPVPVEPTPAQSSGGGFSGVLGALKGAGVAAPIIATVAAGVVSSELQGRFVEEVLGGGEGKGNAARVFGPPMTIALTVDKLTKESLDFIGVDDKGTQKHLGMTAGIAAPVTMLVGAPAALGVAGIKILSEGASSLIGATLGKKTETAVRNAVSQFDPTSPNSVAGKITGKIGGTIKGWFS